MHHSPRRLFSVSALGVVVSFAQLACSGPPPDEPEPDVLTTLSLAGLRLVVDGAVTIGVPTRVVLTAVGTDGIEPYVGFDEVAALVVDRGTIAPTTVALEDGAGEAMVSFSGATGAVTLTATVDDVETSVVVDVAPTTSIPGDPDAPLATALAYVPYVADLADYADDAADLPGFVISFSVVVASVDAMTTIGEMNALLARHDASVAGFVPDESGDVGAIVALRLTTSNHEELALVLPSLIEEGALRGVHRDLVQPDAETDILLEGLALPPPGASGDVPSSWTWERDDQPQPAADGNWGLEHLRVPQVWNLSALATSSPGVVVGVLDGGFVTHFDYLVENMSPALASDQTGEKAATNNNHGLHVAGTIGATFANGRGVDGVNPFARLVGRRFPSTSTTWGVIDFIQQNADLDIVNVSLGYGWGNRPPETAVNPNHDAEAQYQVISAALVMKDYLDGRAASGIATPLLIVAAGNDSGKAVLGGEDILARFSSPLGHAAIDLGVPGILVVEAVKPPVGGALARASFSNIGGHVSAPGVRILSLGATAPYLTMQGTSMATPHVTGVVSLLMALVGPAVSPQKVLDAVRATTRAVPTPDTASAIDAFAAALALDVELGEPRMLRRLADMDDGTLDGNLRVDPTTFATVLDDTTATRDGVDLGPAGDGVVDMRDFRRFRDALLLVEDGFDLVLDGDAQHPKRDLNGDGVVAEPEVENVFPRFDLNGDGRVHRSTTVEVGSLMQRAATDLEVMQHVWDDDDVPASELPLLLDSGDVHIDASALLESGAYGAIELSFSGAVSRVVRVTLDEPRAVVTLPVGTSAVTLSFLDGSDTLIDTAFTEVTTALGADALFVVAAPAVANPYYLVAYLDGDDFTQCGGEPITFWIEGRVEDYDTEDGIEGLTIAFFFNGQAMGTGVSDASGRAQSETFEVTDPGEYEIGIVVEGYERSSIERIARVRDCRQCFDGSSCQRTEVEEVVCGADGSVLENNICQANALCDCQIENCIDEVTQVGDTLLYTCSPI